MRVLHVIPAVAPRYGGPSAAIVPMCRALQGLGIDTLIASTDADGPRQRLHVPLDRETSWQGAPARFFARNFSEAYKYSRGLAAWLEEHVAGFDVVHVHAVFSHAPLAAAAAARRAGVPYVVRPMGTVAPWSLSQKPVRKQALLGLGARRMLRQAAAIHYTSHQERDEVERTLGLSRGVVIPLGMDSPTAGPRSEDDGARRHDPYVLALSRIHPKKNLEALIDAFVDATSNNRCGGAWRMVLAGAGEQAYVDRLRQHVVERRAADRITFLGWVEGQEKADLIRGASLFVLCSLHENFGLGALEAMAAGVPVLVTPEVGLSEWVRPTGAGWVADASEKSVSAALSSILNDTPERDRRGMLARNLSQEFAWPVVCARLARLYEAATDRSGPDPFSLDHRDSKA